MDLDLALDRLAETATRILSADAAAVLLPNEAKDRLAVAATYGIDPEAARQHIQVPLPPPLPLPTPPGYTSVAHAPIPLEGEPAGLLCVYDRSPRQFTAEDTHRLQAVASLGSVLIKAVQKVSSLEQIDAAKSQFIHIATHELRSPITVAQSLLRTVLKGYAGPLTEQQREIFARVASRLDFLESLVNDLLDLAASKAPELAEEEGPVAVNASVGRAALLLQPRAEEKGVTLTVRPCCEELAVWATEDGLDRIFTNLIGNAVKYTPPGGSVTVSLGRVGDLAQVKIADTGIGIPEEALPHLFEEFYRAPNARQFAVGTGLGLAIVKELVERYRGEIRVESEVGQGTTFTLLFPIWQPEE